MRIVDGASREVRWPKVEFFWRKNADPVADAILMPGVEPNLKWRSFCSEVIDLARSLGAKRIITLGALVTDAVHTRPVPLTGFSTDPDVQAKFAARNISRSNYEGPTGIVGVLHHACSQAGLPSVTLWGAVPHYVAAANNPKTALALLRKVEVLVGVSVDVSELETAAADYERQVALAVQSDPDIQAFVERLERAAESEEQGLPEHMPSGDVLAREFQRFLRQRGQ